MSLPGNVVAAPDGVRGFDTSAIVTASAASTLRTHGYRFSVRYVRRDKPHASALSSKEATSILAAGLGLMVVQYVESESAWIPTAPKGSLNGGIAASETANLGIPPGVTIWCDLEGVKAGTPSRNVIDYCNHWHSAVTDAGFVPGLYVGYHAGLTPMDLYRLLRFTHYWGAYNLNADQYPAVRGLQMKQSQPQPDDSLAHLGLKFQVDSVSADALGGRPTLLALDGWPERP